VEEVNGCIDIGYPDALGTLELVIPVTEGCEGPRRVEAVIYRVET
jgi:hypothetical protein